MALCLAMLLHVRTYTVAVLFHSVFLSLPHVAVTDDLPIWGKLSCVLLRKHMQCTNLIYMEANN